MGYADLHIHSIHSYDGTASVQAILKHTADKTDLDVIAITDHNTMDGVQLALDLAPKYGLQVIPGCEVSTAEGHLLTLFVDHPVQPRLSIIETIEQVREMGGLCIAAHPAARGTHSLPFQTILDLVKLRDLANTFVGVEMYNGGLVYTRNSLDVEKFCQNLPLARVANSDAHILHTIGYGKTKFAGTSVSELRQALIARKTIAIKAAGLTGLDVIRSYLPNILLRKLGWARWNAGPSMPMQYARLSKVFQSVA